MAQIEGNARGGRSANVDVNLIPFIDLMSVLITFLLLTAVWTQLSMIQLGSSIYAKKQADQQPITPPPLTDIPLRLDVKDEGYRLIFGKDTFRFPRQGEKWATDDLLKQLQEIRGQVPEKVDAVLTVDNEVAYEHLIGGFDALILTGFSSVSVSTVEAE